MCVVTSSNPDKITQGQGEYVFFHQMPNGEKRELSNETYEQAYKILNQYSPGAIVNRGSEETKNRFAIIKEKIKQIDPSIETVFIPRTLYELVFIRKCIEEDLKNKSICHSLDKTEQEFMINEEKSIGRHLSKEERTKLREEIETERINRDCWHLAYFKDAGDNDHAGVRNVAYRLNQVIVKTFSPSREGFTHRELSAFAEREIEYLRNYHQRCTDIVNGISSAEEISSSSTPGPTTSFGYESSYKSSAMGLRDDSDAQIVRNALAIECDKIAEHSFILYRGGNYQHESCCCNSNKSMPYSLSFGTSLFAGCIFDGGATAFHFMQKQKDAYAIAIPHDQLNDSPFYIPTTHTITQLFGSGEIFHARTKAWAGHNINVLPGMNCGENNKLRDHLQSKLEQDKLISQFQKYKDSAILLK